MAGADVETVVGVRLKVRTPVSPDLRDLRRAIDSMLAVASRVRVRTVEMTAYDHELKKWSHTSWRVTDLRLGSIEIELVYAGVVAAGAAIMATGNGLEGLIRFAEGIRDWGANKRKARADAQLAEIEVGERQWRLMIGMSHDDVAELIRSVNYELAEHGHDDVQIEGLGARPVKGRRPSPTGPAEQQAFVRNVAYLAAYLDEVQTVTEGLSEAGGDPAP